jgi:hypothetical protein
MSRRDAISANAPGVKQRPPHTLAERKHDLYETPACAVEALLRAEPLLQQPRHIWEPACGRGNIVNVLRAAGHKVIATDLVNYGVPITPPAYYRVDFLLEPKLPAGVEIPLTNPPYKLAAPFVAHALDLGSRAVIMLLRLAFLEGGTGEQEKHRLRRYVLDEIPPARIYVFRKRLPMMHRDGWQGRKATSQTAYAWFVWDRSYTGLTTTERISWER